MRHIVVVPYNQIWPEMFAQEAERISSIIDDDLVSIHHIGSTSVPGMSAKPIIDMLPLVRCIENVNLYSSALEQIGYVFLGENGAPGRRFFCKGSDENRTHHVHIYEPDHPDVKSLIGFRDYLRAHPVDALSYAKLKIELAQLYPHDIVGYMAGKNKFFREIAQRVDDWGDKKSS